jgi:peptidoglycan LD-endopeptidase LytH
MNAQEIIAALKKHQSSFHPVVPFDVRNDRLLLLDFTSGNKELTNEIVTDTQKFTNWVNDKLKNAHTKYGIGGYAENRTVYRVSKVFDGNNPDDEPRRLHLGTDIWGKPNTAVICPLDGIVHSFAFNNRYGDYGATIILSHNLEGLSFYTLYGHLSLSSIGNAREGERIERGDTFAGVGIPSENGQWPPHLHFQLIIDIGNWKGDYPGVCKFSEKEKWLDNCPDPDLILQLNQYLNK